MTEDWATELRRGAVDRAWDLFLGRYRRLIFAAIRHCAQDATYGVLNKPNPLFSFVELAPSSARD